MRKLAVLLLLVVVVGAAGCERKPPSPPTPNPGGGETISGSERLGWDQQADGPDELATFRYAIFVDGNRFEVSAVSCGPSPSGPAFACSGRLPAMSAGTHALQLSTFVVRDGETLESERSAPLNIVVSAAAASAGERATSPAAGAVVTTADGAAFRVVHLADGLERPADLAIAPDGRVFVAEETGRISIVEAGRRHTALEPVPGSRTTVLALTLDPQFARSGLVYIARAVLDSGPPAFQLVRYREVGGTLGQAATLLDHVPASSAQPAAALRFGPDGRLFAAFEQPIDAQSAEGAFNGKVLRINPDGTTPRDQRGGSPVLAAGARRPRGLDWDPAGALWIVDGDVARSELLIGIRPDRSPDAPSVSFALPLAFGASSAAFHPSGDLLIGAETGGYVLRVRFDPANRQRVLGTERMLEGKVDAVRALAVTPDGSVYVCTNTTLMTLKPRTR